MKFSIVIPVYNVEEYLDECIESVLSQTYLSFEIILVDDGSTDCSGQICDHYSKQYPDRVKVIHNENQGPLMARFCGMKHASGDILWCVDSDDKIRPDALEVLKAEFEKTACDLVLFSASQQDDFKKSYFEYPFADGQCFSSEGKKTLYETMIVSSKLNSLCYKALKRSVAEAIPENYTQFGIKNAEDLLYSMALLTDAKKVVYINQNLYYYRSRPGSVVHTYNPQKPQSIKKVHMEMEKYIDAWGMGAFHAKHYAREVRGWVDCLKSALMNSGSISASVLVELAEDDYFRNAYCKMEKSELSGREFVLSKLLYEKRYGCLKCAARIVRFIKWAKLKMKGKCR